jgi:hypothetical protein
MPALLVFLDRLGAIGGVGAALSLAALIWLAARHRLGRFTLLAALFAAKAMLYLLTSTPLVPALPLTALLALSVFNLLLSLAVLLELLRRQPMGFRSLAAFIAFAAAATGTAYGMHFANAHGLLPLRIASVVYVYSFWAGSVAETLLWLLLGAYALLTLLRAASGQDQTAPPVL